MVTWTAFALAWWTASVAVAAPPSFSEFDRDRSRSISESEFLAHGNENSAIGKRDFRLCDWTGDGTLSPGEFAGCPTHFPPDDRGPWPDPLDDVRQRYLDLVDQHWAAWDTNQDGQLSHAEFLKGTLPLPVTPLKTAAVNASDPNGDGIVSREEVRGVIERMLGYRTWNDLPLRHPNGCLTNGSLFRSLDRNDDGSLFPTELAALARPDSTAPQTWRILDADRDGKVEFVEWHKAEQFSRFDSLVEFRRMDTNPDGRLDSDELRAVPASHQRLAAALLPGFDHDQDGGLSLSEFRVCPLGNPVLDWHSELSDPNNDGQLVFEEFQFGRGQYRLLAWEYFQRFDWNEDQALDPNEFHFRTKQPDAIYTINEDGSGWNLWFGSPAYSDLESVAVSPDGQNVAFTRWKHEVGGAATSSELCVMDRARQTLRSLGAGRSASWSPDGRSLLCQRTREAGNPSTTVTLEGEEVERTGARPDGVWSPDGTRLASTAARYLLIQDGVTFRQTPIIEPASCPYDQLDEPVCWSPDSRWLCLRATKADRSLEIVTVSTGGAELGFRVHGVVDRISGNIAWHPRGERIVFSKFCPERERVQLYEFHPDRDDPPRLFPGQDARRNNTDASWTPDGTTLFVISGDF